jgi:hypothetical protein
LKLGIGKSVKVEEKAKKAIVCKEYFPGIFSLFEKSKYISAIPTEQRGVRMSHKFPRVFRIAIICCVLLAGISSAQKKPTVAVLELAGNGIDTAGLSTLTNRLRAELFETQKFTIVERGEMEAILKEQGFQQTGCTDAACAVQVGQMLNAEYMIVGTVDHIGRVYSVNIRQISVANGAITNNVKSDCADCSVEDVMLKKIRQAARQIAGIDTTREQEVVTEQMGRKSIKCKKYTGGEAGTLAISVIPPDGEVLVDGISYGTGSMVINYMPVGWHLVCVKNKKEIMKEKVSIEYNKATECVMNLNTKYHFCIEAGVAIAFPKISHFQRKFVNQNNAGDTITAPTGSTWIPIMPTLSFNWRNQKNTIGFMLGAMEINVQMHEIDSAGNDFVFSSEKAFFELLFNYYRTVLNLKDYLKAGVGLECGLSMCYWGLHPQYAIAKATQERYLPLGGTLSGQRFLFGGPSVAINTGYKFLYFNAVYTLLLGINSYDSVGYFNVMHNIGLNIGFKF